MKINGQTVKAKVKIKHNPLFGDEKYTGTEPVWDTERAKVMTDEQFDHFLRKSFFYYNYFYNQKDCKKYIIEWMKNPEYKFTKEDIKSFIRSGDKTINQTACSLVMAHRQGMPFRGRHLDYIINAIRGSINAAEPEVTETVKVEAYKPTIQDRLNEKTSELIGELEGQYDELATNPKFTFNVYDFLLANNVPQSQLNKYEEVYQSRFDELKMAFEKKDEQLVEGYSHLKTSDFKRYFTFLDKLLSDIAQYRGTKKATKKVRVKRAVSKEKVVAKLKYTKEDKGLKLVSVNPADIVGAQELWVYNTKTRKLGKYVPEDQFQTLSVKGTSIINFSDVKSVSKTLRKPEEKLREFAKASKVELRKFMENIKATETRLNGRIGPDVILLKTA